MDFPTKINLGGSLIDGDGGLTPRIFTRDLEKAERYAAELRYGEVQVNSVRYGIDSPHCRIGQSGIGHDCSFLALNDELVLKRVTRALNKGPAREANV